MSEKHVVIAEHQLQELPLSTYNCEYCGFSVKTKANLRAHHIKTHKILKTDSDLAFFSKRKRQSKYVYHCPVVPCKHNIDCGGGFSSTSRLKQHYQIVHMQRSLKCSRCSALFSTPASLSYHMRSCGTLFTCPICSREYSYKKHLDQHFRRSGHRAQVHNTTKKTCHTTTSQNGIAPVTTSPSAAPVTTSMQFQTLMLPVVVLPVTMTGSIDCKTECGPTNVTGNFASRLSIMPLIFQAGFSLPDLLSNVLSGAPSTINQFQAVQPSPQLPTPITPPVYVDSSTQTENEAPVPTNMHSVSVKTCTDEDDISTFIGSFFCDAGVNATFPLTECSTNTTEIPLNPDVNENSQLTLVPSPSATLEACSTSATPKPSPPFLTFNPVDEAIQTGLLCSFEHASMQTENVSKLNVGASTHDISFRWAERPLETPPPFCSSENVTCLLNLSATHTYARGNDSSDRCTSINHSGVHAIDNFLRGSQALAAPQHLKSVDAVLPSHTPSNHTDFGCLHVPASHSIGLQSYPTWSSSDRLYSSIASQTFPDDLDAWLNNVHTQTSTSSPPDLHSFVKLDENGYINGDIDPNVVIDASFGQI